MAKNADELYDKMSPVPLERNPVTQEILSLIERYDRMTKELDHQARLIFKGQSEITEYALKKYKRRTQAIFDRIDESIKKWVEICVPESYMSGSDLVDIFADYVEENSSRFLGSIDSKKMISYLDRIKNNSYREVKMVNDKMRKNLDDIIYQGIKDSRGIKTTINAGVRGGTTTKKQIGTRVYQDIVNKGIKLEDAAGRLWDPGAYSRMYARTRTREWQTQGTEDRLQQNGLDLVRISQHTDVDGWDICNEYEDKIFSLSGNHPVYPMLDEHTPFHPNCGHVETPYIEEMEEFIKARKEGKSVEEAAGLSKKKTSTGPNKNIDPNYRSLAPGLNDEGLQGLEKTHKDVRKFGIKNNREQLATINVNDGKESFRKLGGEKSSVKFTPDYINHLENAPDKSLIIVHNHPGSSSFSIEDTFIPNQFKSVKAMTVEGHNKIKYYLDIGKRSAADRDTIKSLFSSSKDKYFDFMRDKVVGGDLDSDLAWRIHSHLAMKDTSQLMGWNYKRIIPDDFDIKEMNKIKNIEKEAADYVKKKQEEINEIAQRRGVS